MPTSLVKTNDNHHFQTTFFPTKTKFCPNHLMIRAFFVLLQRVSQEAQDIVG